MERFTEIELSEKIDNRPAYKGKCSVCGVVHAIAIGPAKDQAVALIRRLQEHGRIDFDLPESEADPRFSTDYLYGDARGQMFGVLVCRDRQGRTGVLKAFSGQYNSVWDVPGWVPPLINPQALNDMSFGIERHIKKLGREIDSLPTDSPRRKTLVERRRSISQALMKDIHAQYLIPNFRRQLKPMPEIVYGRGGIPSGTGDCCAPKLIGYAARHSMTPLGLVEFYFGRENKSGTKKHGKVYSSCADKCGRILGYMLCGLEKR